VSISACSSKVLDRGHAVDAGYADQSHLVRECKEISGRTPTQIARQARHDEPDWVYRLL